MAAAVMGSRIVAWVDYPEHWELKEGIVLRVKGLEVAFACPQR